MNAHPLVVVSAGSYHLSFDRLIDWMEPWSVEHPEARLVVQHGPSRPLPGAENHVVLPYRELLEQCALADAVVLQGGAGGVMDMRAIGRLPIVVPRVPVGDEVVDEHQLIFTEQAERLGAVRRALTKESLWDLLDRMLDGSENTRVGAATPTPGVAAIGSVLAERPQRLAPRARARRFLISAGSLIRR